MICTSSLSKSQTVCCRQFIFYIFVTDNRINKYYSYYVISMYTILFLVIDGALVGINADSLYLVIYVHILSEKKYHITCVICVYFLQCKS